MEMLFTQLLHHPYIVQVVDVAETAGHVLITMEYLPRGSLFKVLKALAEDGRLLDGLTCRKYCQQMASAVAYCHKSNVVHLDIKSDNFMVGNDDQIRLIDFGFSEAIDPNKQFHMHIGTPEYMSPECALGLAFVGPEADIWSLGVTFFEMVTGLLPIKSQEEQDEECDAYDQRTALQQTFAKKPSRSPMARFEARISFPAKTDKDFVHLARHMLHPVRECRASIDQVLHHPWMTAKGSTSIDTHVPSRPALVASPDLRAVAEVQRFGFSKAAVLTSVATIALDQRDPAVSLYHLAHEKIERQEAFERDVAAERRRAAGQPATALPCAPVAKTDSDKTMAGDDQPPPASDSVRANGTARRLRIATSSARGGLNGVHCGWLAGWWLAAEGIH
ncbi:kinase-like domain-containing protein [Entophlyctis helioformis]|nr:kinase-like domain-containing protein [Entophlyctis helioformis]